MLVLFVVLAAGCTGSRDAIVGSWSNWLAAGWNIAYTFYENGTVVYSSGAHSGHDVLVLRGTWKNMGRVDDPCGVSGVYYTLDF